MKYDEKRNCIGVSSDELIVTALGCSSAASESDEYSVCPASKQIRLKYGCDEEQSPLSYTEIDGEHQLEISADADKIEDSGDCAALCFVFTCDADVRELPASVKKYVRAKAFCASYIYSAITGRKRISLKIICVNEENGYDFTIEESPKFDALDKFFAKLLYSFHINAKSEIERVCKRLPTMKALRFPYKSVREGQGDFMSSCYSAIKKKRVLTACAPTGTGKTVSVLYPAVRAMGEGACSKVFYLTPKGTTAIAAADTVAAMCAQGARINSIILSAKERICQNGVLCRRGNACERSRFTSEQTRLACEELQKVAGVTVERKHINEVAKRYNICPYELSLNFSMLCDIIICDYNYLFDPRAYLRRYFDRHGDYCFLIDEAHNLPDRARDTYSADISLSELREAAKEFSRHESLRKTLSDGCHDFTKLLFPLCRQEMRISLTGEKSALVCQSALPDGIFELFTKLKHTCERNYFSRRGDFSHEEYRRLRDFLSKMRTLVDIFKIYDRKFNTFIILEGKEITLKIRCIDPSSIIGERLDCGSSAVMFSATLLPADYYRALLTNSRNSQSIEIPSPFDRERLCIAILDNVSTRYSDREANAPEISRAISTAVRARVGNYMVFCPSFAYMEHLASVFGSTNPDVSIILQKRKMTQRERVEFLASFKEHTEKTIVAFCVMGGIYSEGIDLAGDRLIGAIIIGAGMPMPTLEREAMRAYYQELYEAGHEYAYVYPGMNRVLQAAGRVIRRDDDRGILLLIDDRFKEGVYRRILPDHWHSLKYTGDVRSLSALLEKFWREN